MKTVTVLARGMSNHKGPEVAGDLICSKNRKEVRMAEGVCERMEEGEGTRRRSQRAKRRAGKWFRDVPNHFWGR